MLPKVLKVATQEIVHTPGSGDRDGLLHHGAEYEKQVEPHVLGSRWNE